MRSIAATGHNSLNKGDELRCWEFGGALDIIPADNGDYYLIDANATPGTGDAFENRIASLRKHWERDPR